MFILPVAVYSESEQFNRVILNRAKIKNSTDLSTKSINDDFKVKVGLAEMFKGDTYVRPGNDPADKKTRFLFLLSPDAVSVILL